MPSCARSDGPTFSIILPTCRRAGLLRRAVASVLAQTFEDWELLVVDDGGAGGDLLGDLRDPRIRVLRTAGASGVAHARNRGLGAAAGDYIAFLDDDDAYLSSFLRATYDHLTGTPADVGMSWCSVRYDDAADPGGGREALFRVEADAAERMDDLLSIGMGFGVTIKRACLERVGAFDESLKAVEDLDLFLRVLLAGFEPTVVPGVHVTIHNHSLPRLTDVQLHPVRIRECRWLLDRYGHFVDAHPHVRSRLLEHVSLLERELAGKAAGDADAAFLPLRRKGWPSMGRWQAQVLARGG